MAHERIVLRGKLAGVKPEDVQRLGIYLVRGEDVIAHGSEKYLKGLNILYRL